MLIYSHSVLCAAEKQATACANRNTGIRIELGRRAAGQQVGKGIERLYKYLRSSLVFYGPARVETRFGHPHFVDRRPARP